MQGLIDTWEICLGDRWSYKFDLTVVSSLVREWRNFSMRFLTAPGNNSPKLPLVKDIIDDTKRCYKRVLSGNASLDDLRAFKTTIRAKSDFIQRRIAKCKGRASDDARLNDLQDLEADIDAVKL